MEHILSQPVPLPSSNPTESYWQQPPSAISSQRTTSSLPPSADIVIIGSGISGASTAYHLLSSRPDLNIVMLEARAAASGASGRNGGHTKHASYRKFSDDVRLVGLEDAKRIARLEFDCMRAVHGFIRDQAIECDAHSCDTVDVYYDVPQFERARVTVEEMKRVFGEGDEVVRYDFFNSRETEKEFLCPGAVGAVRYEAGSLSAYRFTIAVLQRALGLGLNLQTHTPVTALKKEDDGKWTVRTADRGDIVASKVIVATNGYTPHLLPQLQGAIVPFRGIVTAQRPGKNMPQRGLPVTYSFAYEKGYDYMITRQAGDQCEGDIVIGGGLTKAEGDGIVEFANTDDTVVNPDIEAYLNGSLVDFFGKQNWGQDHPEGRVRRCWSGVMGYSADGYPYVGEVPGEKGLWIDASFQGHGMVLCFLCARAVSEMITGRDGEELDRWFPRCFRVTEKRMGLKFKGLHHVPDVDGEERRVDMVNGKDPKE